MSKFTKTLNVCFSKKFNCFTTVYLYENELSFPDDQYGFGVNALPFDDIHGHVQQLIDEIQNEFDGDQHVRLTINTEGLQGSVQIPYYKVKKLNPEVVFETISNIFGFIYCTVLPNQRQLFPALPSKNGNGRLVFTSCRSCSDSENVTDLCQHSEDDRCLEKRVFFSEELYFAVEQLGYKIIKVFEVYHYPKQSNLIFKDFIDKLNIIKTTNTNMDGQFNSEEQFDEFIKQINEETMSKQNDSQRVISKADFHHNPCKRNLAKLLMNSSYGRLGIRPAHNEKLFIRERKELVQLLEDPAVSITALDPLKCGNALRASVNIDLEQTPALPVSSVGLASAITSMARLHLLKAILHANKQSNVIPLYTDTDCIFTLHRKTIDENDFILDPGMKIGQMKRELGSDDFIESFVCLGAKVYGYQTERGETKICCKGIQQSTKSEKKLNVKTMETYLQNRIAMANKGIDGTQSMQHQQPIVINQTQFTRKMLPEPSIGQRSFDKKVNVTLNKRVFIFNLHDHVVEGILGYKANAHKNPMFRYYSLPFGWNQDLLKHVAEKFDNIMN